MIDLLAIVVGLVLTFLVVVVVHELGHFVAARIVGVKPEVFSVGFGKVLWSQNTKSGTCWQIAAVPFGGYVRFVGDENAASLSSIPEGPVVPGSLRAVSKLRQAFVVIAGPAANLVLTVFLLSMVSLISGVTAYPWTIERIALPEAQGGLKSGDQLLQVGRTVIETSTDLETILAAQGNDAVLTYRVRRDETEVRVSGRRPDLPLLSYVAPGSPAEAAGLGVGDLLTAIDGQRLSTWSDLQRAVTASGGKALHIEAERSGQIITTTLNPELRGETWLIGVSAAPLFTLVTETPSLPQALSVGLYRSWSLFERTAGGLAMSALGRGDPCALDGPLAIGRVAGQAIQLGPEVFLTFMAVISLGLGLLNLLPIPILDGGHLLILGLEGLTGRAVDKRLQAILFIAGVTLIVFLMLTATVNDLRC